ncbi:unnamed protein product [Urochloa humidicola]
MAAAFSSRGCTRAARIHHALAPRRRVLHNCSCNHSGEPNRFCWLLHGERAERMSEPQARRRARARWHFPPLERAAHHPPPEVHSAGWVDIPARRLLPEQQAIVTQ